MAIIVAGAGMAGLLAANMLHRHDVAVLEKQSQLPNNHSAVLRFRTAVVGEMLGIPFKRVNMVKAVAPWHNPVADSLAYAFKNTGQYRSDRSIIDGTVSAERYIAPPDMLQRMAAPLRIAYDVDAFNLENSGKDIISTIPMPALMKILGYPRQLQFNYLSAINIKATFSHCDSYVSLLVPDPESIISRISLSGNEMTVECPGWEPEEGGGQAHSIASEAAQLLGFKAIFNDPPTAIRSHYAKILPIDNDARKEFIHWATVQHNIYSLGRFATWRPGLLTDDLVKDIRLIEGWIQSKSRYDLARSR